MKRIFIGQRTTGENWDELVEDTEKICDALDNSNCITYSTLDDKELKFKKKGEWLFHAFKEIDKSDYFLAIVKSEKSSEGLLIEIGYALAKNKNLILAIKQDVKNTYLRDMTKKVIEFESISDLVNKLSKLKL